MLHPDTADQDGQHHGPRHHLGRKVFLALLIPGVLMAVVCWWRGWSSADEISYALMVTALLVFLAGMLPSVGARQSGWNLAQPFPVGRWDREHRDGFDELASGLSPEEAYRRDQGYIAAMTIAAVLFLAAGVATGFIWA